MWYRDHMDFLEVLIDSIVDIIEGFIDAITHIF